MEKEHLLFLVHRIPYPPNKGDKIRSWHILQNLSEIYDVHVGGFIDHEPDWAYIPNITAVAKSHCFLPLKPIYAKIRSLKAFVTGKSLTEYYFFDVRLAEWAEGVRVKHNIKKVFVFSSGMAPYIMNERWLDATKVMDFVDVDSDKWRQYAMQQSFPLSWVYRRESVYLAKFEEKVAAYCDANLFVSEKEKNFFTQHYTPQLSIKNHTVPNGVDFSFWNPMLKMESPYPTGSYPIVFSGAMDYWPNIDAVLWFVSEVMPLVRSVIPNVIFTIVGSNPTKDVQALQQSDVIVTGSVKDIRPYILNAEICVAPMRVSRGIQNKVLEGMAMGRPVLATSLALSSLLNLKDEALEADEPQDYLEHIMALYKMPASAIDLGRKARCYIEKHCAWDKSFSLIQSFLHR